MPLEAFSPARLAEPANKDVARVRHPEWVEHQLRWRMLLDSLEGGERYRQAIYGTDTRGMPVRNLVRHKREYGDPRTQPSPTFAQPLGSDPTVPATDDDYEMRRARTPIPTFVPETVDSYLGRIYSRKVRRDYPESEAFARVRAWSRDADGKGADVDRWMETVVGRVLLTAGCCDVLATHPAKAPGLQVRSRYDELVHGLDDVVARVVLPQNLTYWELDAKGRYTLAVVVEWPDGGDADPNQLLNQAAQQLSFAFAGGRPIDRPRCNYRVWTATHWHLYDDAGSRIAGSDHPFKRVPLVRIGCRPKPRCVNVYQSPLESIAERQREFYNRDSELILSDNYHSHPILQGPEDLFTDNGQVKAGPGGVLPKKKYGQGTTQGYEAWDVLTFPTDGAESLRQNKADLREEVDRDAALMKPAGAAGTKGGTVSQSGVSKEIDNEALHDRLSAVAKILERAEDAIFRLVADVGSNGDAPDPRVDGNRVKVCYPTQFSLLAPEKIAQAADDFQTLLKASGQAPQAEKLFLSELVRKALPGREDKVYQDIDEEIEAAIEKNAEAARQEHESPPAPPAPTPPEEEEDDPPEPPDVGEDEDGDDPDDQDEP